MKTRQIELQQSLKRRGLDFNHLASLANCGRSHLSQVLNGRRPGSQTRRKLKRHLTEAEMGMLGWKQ